MVQSLGKLTPVPLREAWPEELLFSRWLAEPDNLELLSDAIGLQLEVEGTEVAVGGYRADILARDSETEGLVIIENQLGKTDHDHLGKLLTYAGFWGAGTIVWISRTITDEHRRALEWLNEVAGEKLRVFGIEIELWSIEDSPPAPKFNLVCTPNELLNVVRSAEPASQTRSLQLEYWNGFKDFLETAGSKFHGRTPRAQHWYDFAIGRAGFNLSLTVNTKVKRIGCELFIGHPQASRAYKLLYEQRDQIEDELGPGLEWLELPERHSCRIVMYHDGDVTDQSSWPDLSQWMAEKLVAFEATFGSRVRALHLEGPALEAV
jgi:hypothetical protein